MNRKPLCIAAITTLAAAVSPPAHAGGEVQCNTNVMCAVQHAANGAKAKVEVFPGGKKRTIVVHPFVVGSGAVDGRLSHAKRIRFDDQLAYRIDCASGDVQVEVTPGRSIWRTVFSVLTLSGVAVSPRVLAAHDLLTAQQQAPGGLTSFEAGAYQVLEAVAQIACQ